MFPTRLDGRGPRQRAGRTAFGCVTFSRWTMAFPQRQSVSKADRQCIILCAICQSLLRGPRSPGPNPVSYGCLPARPLGRRLIVRVVVVGCRRKAQPRAAKKVQWLLPSTHHALLRLVDFVRRPGPSGLDTTLELLGKKGAEKKREREGQMLNGLGWMSL